MTGMEIVLALGDVLSAPAPSDGEEFNSVTVSPGLPGFFATFILAVLVVLLAIDMTRRTRRVQAKERVRLRAEAEERVAREQAEQPAPGETDGAEGPADGDASPADGDASPADGADEGPSSDDPPRPDDDRR